MPMNKKALGALALAFALAGCAQSPDSVMQSFDADQMRYDIDSQTGLCFSIAAMYIRDAQGYTSAQLSHSNVPCIEPVLKQVSQEKLARMRDAGIAPVIR
jgi:hypothetical protein